MTNHSTLGMLVTVGFAEYSTSSCTKDTAASATGESSTGLATKVGAAGTIAGDRMVCSELRVGDWLDEGVKLCVGEVRRGGDVAFFALVEHVVLRPGWAETVQGAAVTERVATFACYPLAA